MRIGVVLPLLQGRELFWARTLEAFRNVDLVSLPALASVGDSWNAGAKMQRDWDYVCFAADDAVPHEGCLEAAIAACERGWLPAATIYHPNGELQACGSDSLGQTRGVVSDGEPCLQSGLPFMPWSTWETVGEFLPIHYYVDDNWYGRARSLGFEVRTCAGYAFTHYSQTHKPVQDAAMDHKDAAYADLAERGVALA